MLAKRCFFISLTFLIALMLSIIPVPAWVNGLQPAWVVMVLIYWIFDAMQVGLGVALLLGLGIDTLGGSLLGEHALAMTVVAFIAIKSYRLLRVFPLWQQTFFIFFLILIYQLLLFLIQGISGQVIVDWRYWFVPVMSMLFWPCFFLLLRKYSRWFNLA